MIKNSIIRIDTHGCRKKVHFQELGYDISGEYIDLKVEHLNKGSRQLVDVICDYCNDEVIIIYREYLRNISNGGKYSCSRKCGALKIKETNLEKYGVEHPMMLEEIKDKVKKTNLEKYGVEYLQQSEIMRNKTKETCLEKYGYDHISKTKNFKKSVKETCLIKYGTESYMNSDDFKKKSKKTLFKNYGVDNPSKSIEIKEIIKKSNLLKFGFYHHTQRMEFREKYSIYNHTKSDEYRKNRFVISNDLNYIKYLDNSISLFSCNFGYKHNFEISSDNYYHRNKNNIPLCTVCNPIGDQKSIKEKMLYEFIKNIYSGEVISSYRDGLEIDIYLPDINLGFEFNGLYYHSSKFKENGYHLNKTNYFKERNIRIVHIWEDDWDYKKDIIKSQINNLLKNNINKIFARKCIIKEVVVSESIKFLNSNHIQGKANSSLKLGLYHNDILVSLMTFDRYEGRKSMGNGGWNLNRFCNLVNTNVIGGASKLLSYFIKNYDVKRIISYADKDWSIGNLYETLGFKNIGGNGPDYKYIVDGKRVHKSRYKKSKLNTKLTESQEMSKRGILKIYDCGKLKYEKILK